MKKIKLILASLVIIGAVLLVAGSTPPAQKAEAATAHLTACGTLNQANTTYVLDNDILSPATCMTISANNITLDLNGKTITYNTSASETPVRGITINVGAGLSTPIVIKNGFITQGEGASTHSDAIYNSNGNGSNIEITGITTTVNGNSSHAILIYWGQGGFNIHDNTFISNISAIVNRGVYDGYAIQIANNKGPAAASITDNKITGGQGGIAITGGPSLTIARNNISQNAFSGNGYGVLVSGITNGKIYQNNIHTNDGCGILLDTNFNDVEIYSNTIDTRQPPVGDAGAGWGIKIRTYPDSNASLLKVHDNNIKVTTGPGLNQAAGIGIYSALSHLNAQYYNNNITAVALPGTAWNQYSSGIKISGSEASDTDTLVYNNTITSDGYNIWFSDNDGNGSDGIVFTSNTLIKGNNPSPGTGYHTIREGFWYWATTDHVFLDTRLQNGASLRDIYRGGNSSPEVYYSFYVKWFLNLTVKDASGNLVSGATVNAIDQNNNLELTITTDEQGKAQLPLTDYYQYGTTQVGTTAPPTLTYSTPHTINISKVGVGIAQGQVTMDASKSLVMILSSGPSIVKSVDKASAASGETLTYTVSYSNLTQTAFPNAKIEDPIPNGTTYVVGSATGGATFNGSKIILNIGNLAAGASGSIQFQVRVQ